MRLTPSPLARLGAWVCRVPDWPAPWRGVVEDGATPATRGQGEVRTPDCPGGALSNHASTTETDCPLGVSNTAQFCIQLQATPPQAPQAPQLSRLSRMAALQSPCSRTCPAATPSGLLPAGHSSLAGLHDPFHVQDTPGRGQTV